MAKSDATKKVSWRVNLKELFGKTLPDNEALKKRIGTELIARIASRTQSGVDKNDRRFRAYSKEYAKQKGTGRGDVDLTLQNKMLRNMVIEKMTKNTVTIGFKTAKQRLKAENHIHGVTLPKRDFLGLPEEELEEVKVEFEDEVG